MESGTIVEKQFQPAHFETYTAYEPWMPKGMQFQIKQRFIPDRWFIILEDTDEKSHVHSEMIQVPQEEYKQINIGERYYLPGGTERISN
jgi:hypothetical protein